MALVTAAFSGRTMSARDVRPCTTLAPNHNAVAITTSAGRLFLTTSGLSCGGTDTGTWQAVGGTGIFANASGGGTVQTKASGGQGTPQNPIMSTSTYGGMLRLH